MDSSRVLTLTSQMALGKAAGLSEARLFTARLLNAQCLRDCVLFCSGLGSNEHNSCVGNYHLLSLDYVLGTGLSVYLQLFV